MNPGATTRPAASTVVVPASGNSETAATAPPRIPTWRTASSPLSGSMTRPPAITRSNDAAAVDAGASDRGSLPEQADRPAASSNQTAVRRLLRPLLPMMFTRAQ